MGLGVVSAACTNHESYVVMLIISIESSMSYRKRSVAVCGQR